MTLANRMCMLPVAAPVIGAPAAAQQAAKSITQSAADAEKHARAAVFAGAVRRGFLVGFGLARGGKPPASPAAAPMK